MPGRKHGGGPTNDSSLSLLQKTNDFIRLLQRYCVNALGMSLACMLDPHLPEGLPLHSMSWSSAMYFTCPHTRPSSGQGPDKRHGTRHAQ